MNNFTILADRRKLSQVLRNLIGNSLKFTPKYGAVLIKGNLVINEKGGKFLKIEVTDSGQGIRPVM